MTRVFRVDLSACAAATLVASALAATLGVGGLAPSPAWAQATADDGSTALGEALLGDVGDAEGPAKLEADDITYDPVREIVTASGDVQVFFGERVLRADELVYDAKADMITARGNIRLINPDGSVLEADEASFDSKIRDGLIVGAKAILADGRSRLASVEGRRVDGKFTQLSKAVFSTCEVCEDDPTPLWRIRARKVIQDEEARDIIYQDATFDAFGLPIFYTPYFRHADPTVKRRSGFLTPSFRTTNELGFTAQIPYYHTFAPNRDLTATAYLATDDNPVAVGEYRALETWGRYTLGGSYTYSRRDIDDSGGRGHFEGSGRVAAPLGFTAGFDALIASDDTYLRRYRFSGTDRAEARVFAERFRDDGFYSAEAVRYQSFRSDEPSGEIPLVAPLLEFEQFFDAPMIGGEVEVSANSLFLRRTEGRDVARLSGALGWGRTLNTRYGLVLEGAARVRGDVYRTLDDPDRADGYDARLLPQASLRMSYPLGKVTETASHVIEPLATLVYAPYGGNDDDIPNEDSLDIELDELRIFSPNRVTGIDRWEDGPRATAGVRYNRMSMRGWEVDFAFGQSYRLQDTDAFSDSSGLNGTNSDFVGSFRVAFGSAFEVGQRYRFGTDFDVERYEAFGRARILDRLTLSGTYVFAGMDPVAEIFEDREEVTGRASLVVTDFWTLSGVVRRDLEQDRFVSAGAGVRYSDECFEADLGMRRRFNDVDDAGASTDFQLQVRLKGIDSAAGPRSDRSRLDRDERSSSLDSAEGGDRRVANGSCSRLPKPSK